jgi:hypothetical protein
MATERIPPGVVVRRGNDAAGNVRAATKWAGGALTPLPVAIPFLEELQWQLYS